MAGDIKVCRPGYFGPFCNSTCPPKSFGAECGGNCVKCPVEECDHVHGCPPNIRNQNNDRYENFDNHQPVNTTYSFQDTSEKNILVRIEKDSALNFALIGLIGSLLFCLVLFLMIYYLCKKSKSANRKKDNNQTHEKNVEDGKSSNTSQKNHRVFNSSSNTFTSDHFYQPLEGEYEEIQEGLMLVPISSAESYEIPCTSRKSLQLNENTLDALNAHFDVDIAEKYKEKNFDDKLPNVSQTPLTLTNTVDSSAYLDIIQ